MTMYDDGKVPAASANSSTGMEVLQLFSMILVLAQWHRQVKIVRLHIFHDADVATAESKQNKKVRKRQTDRQIETKTETVMFHRDRRRKSRK